MIYRTPEPDALELAVIERIDALRSRLSHVVRSEPRRWTGRLRRHALARALRGSNSIEGFLVSKSDALAAVEGEAPMEASDRDWAAISSFRNAMTYVIHLHDDPRFQYSESLIRSLHYMMLQYDLSKSPGRYRSAPIFVIDEDLKKTVYEGPDEGSVPSLVEELITSLNSSDGTPCLVRAAMAHLNLVMIHPFRDGNGRMARALQTLVLVREGIIAPEFSSIEEYLGRNYREYYDILASVGGGRWRPNGDARPWVRFSLKSHFQQTTTVLQRVYEGERLWELLAEAADQNQLPERSVLALFDAAVGFRVRNGTYRQAADISSQMASRDLARLVETGLLEPHGEKKGRYYEASARTKRMGQRAKEARPPLEDPFETTPPPQLRLVLPS